MLLKYILAGFLCIFWHISDAQIMYRSRYTSAFLLEGFGISPIASVNYERAPLRYHKYFIAGRVGVGILPAKAGNGGGISIPVGASCNWLVNNLEKGIYRRVMNKCRTKPSKTGTETFLESGVGYARIIYPSEQRNYYNVLVGVRTNFFFDSPPKVNVFYARITLNPRVTRKGLLFYEKTLEGGQNFYGGVSVGMSL